MNRAVDSWDDWFRACELWANRRIKNAGEIDALYALWMRADAPEPKDAVIAVLGSADVMKDGRTVGQAIVAMSDSDLELMLGAAVGKRVTLARKGLAGNVIAPAAWRGRTDTMIGHDKLHADSLGAHSQGMPLQAYEVAYTGRRSRIPTALKWSFVFFCASAWTAFMLAVGAAVQRHLP